MTPTQHATFTLERYVAASPARVYHAFTDPKARLRWFYKVDSWTLHELQAAEVVETGATERSRFSPPGSDAVLTNDGVYFEVVANERLVYAYAMTLNGAALSASLTTVRFHAEGDGTRVELTEQGLYHDGNIEGRITGTKWMLETLAEDAMLAEG